jgi:hypothetical protein
LCYIIIILQYNIILVCMGVRTPTKWRNDVGVLLYTRRVQLTVERVTSGGRKANGVRARNTITITSYWEMAIVSKEHRCCVELNYNSANNNYFMYIGWLKHGLIDRQHQITSQIPDRWIVKYFKSNRLMFPWFFEMKTSTDGDPRTDWKPKLNLLRS